MKKLLCFLLCLTLIFSSVSLCFASATSWDTTDQANLQSIKSALTSGSSSIYGWVSSINSKLTYNNKSISNLVVDISNLLNNSLYASDGSNSRSIAWWLKEAVLDLDSIKSALVDSSGQGLINYLSNILDALTHTNTAGVVVSWFTDLNTNQTNIYNDQLKLVKALTNYKSRAQGNVTYTTNEYREFANVDMFNGNNGNNSQYGQYPISRFSDDGHTVLGGNGYIGNGSPLGNLLLNLWLFNRSFVLSTKYNQDSTLTGFSSTQTALNWTDLDSQYTFTPLSSTDGLYKWLSVLQAPVARLSYVLASDERIEAQEAVAANEEAVVDNFIDSSGDGATSPSDIGSVSNLSSGYKQNFGSDASVSGIFNIFDSNNMGWFSQETKNQLDTTTPTRLTKGSESETPLLDKQIEDIYNALGVKQP